MTAAIELHHLLIVGVFFCLGLWWMMSIRTRRTVERSSSRFGLGKVEMPPEDARLIDDPDAEEENADGEPREYRTPFMDLPPREPDDR